MDCLLYQELLISCHNPVVHVISLLMWIHHVDEIMVNPDQLASSEASWSGSNHFQKRVLLPGHVVQEVTCLTADPGFMSSNLAQSHTFTEIYHVIISTVILLPSADSRKVVVTYKPKYAHEVHVPG